MELKITEIIQAKKNSERVNLFLNNRFWIGLGKNDLLSLKLTTGKVIDEDEKRDIEARSLEGKLKERAIRFLQLRPRSIKEVRDYLIMKNKIDIEEAESIITYLLDREYLSDEKFAKWYAEYKNSASANGLNKIKMELLQKGIDKSIIATTFDTLKATENFDSDQQEKIQAFIKKVSPNIKAKNDYEFKSKLTQKLLARGFRYEEIKALIKSISISPRL